MLNAKDQRIYSKRSAYLRIGRAFSAPPELADLLRLADNSLKFRDDQP